MKTNSHASWDDTWAAHRHTASRISSSILYLTPYCSSCTNILVSTVWLYQSLVHHSSICHRPFSKVWRDSIFFASSVKLLGLTKGWADLLSLSLVVSCQDNVERWTWRCCSLLQWKPSLRMSHDCRGNCPNGMKYRSHLCCESRQREWRRCRCCWTTRRRIALLGGGGEMTLRVCGDRGVGNPSEKKHYK